MAATAAPQLSLRVVLENKGGRAVSGVDVEGVLAAHPSFVYIAARKEGHIIKCAGWRCRARLVAHRYGDLHATHRAHVAAVLREQIAAAQTEAWDEGRMAGSRDVATRADDWTPNPYRAAQVAPSREGES
jgi:hypothetical protein